MDRVPTGAPIHTFIDNGSEQRILDSGGKPCQSVAVAGAADLLLKLPLRRVTQLLKAI